MHRILNLGIKKNEGIVFPYNSFFDDTELPNNIIREYAGKPESGRLYYRKKSIDKEPILFVLPCNAGASKGNYFLSNPPGYWNAWRAADSYLRHLRYNFVIAACSSVNYHFIDDDGALVFETEMHRVSSNGDFGFPTANRFDLFSKKPDFEIQILIDNLKVGLKRANDYGFKHIVAVMAPVAYKVAFARAVTEMNMWDKVIMCDVLTMGAITYWIKMFNIFYYDNFKHTGIFSYDNIEYKSETKILNNISDELNYTKNTAYKDIPYDFSDVIMKCGGKQYYQPILKCDLNMEINQLNKKYNCDTGSKLVSLHTGLLNSL